MRIITEIEFEDPKIVSIIDSTLQTIECFVYLLDRAKIMELLLNSTSSLHQVQCIFLQPFMHEENEYDNVKLGQSTIYSANLMLCCHLSVNLVHLKAEILQSLKVFTFSATRITFDFPTFPKSNNCTKLCSLRTTITEQETAIAHYLYSLFSKINKLRWFS